MLGILAKKQKIIFTFFGEKSEGNDGESGREREEGLQGERG